MLQDEDPAFIPTKLTLHRDRGTKIREQINSLIAAYTPELIYIFRSLVYNRHLLWGGVSRLGA